MKHPFQQSTHSKNNLTKRLLYAHQFLQALQAVNLCIFYISNTVYIFRFSANVSNEQTNKFTNS